MKVLERSVGTNKTKRKWFVKLVAQTHALWVLIRISARPRKIPPHTEIAPYSKKMLLSDLNKEAISADQNGL